MNRFPGVLPVPSAGVAAAALAALLLGGCRLPQRPAADLIISHARVWTGDPDPPLAESVAILGDRIVAVGSVRDVDRWRGRSTRVLDSRGRLILPGFNDAHVHFVSGGMQLEQVDLKDAQSPQEFANLIAQRAAATPRSEWVLGGNWDETKWAPPRLPT